MKRKCSTETDRFGTICFVIHALTGSSIVR
jgi:hypothetical protein